MGHLKPKLIIKNKLHVFRAMGRVTQQELADKIGVTRATISAIEGADYNPSLELAFRLAKYFFTDIHSIFFEEEQHDHENN